MLCTRKKCNLQATWSYLGRTDLFPRTQDLSRNMGPLVSCGSAASPYTDSTSHPRYGARDSITRLHQDSFSFFFFVENLITWGLFFLEGDHVRTQDSSPPSSTVQIRVKKLFNLELKKTVQPSTTNIFLIARVLCVLLVCSILVFDKGHTIPFVSPSSAFASDV